MKIFDRFLGQSYEYCRRCNANLTLQKGFSNTLPCWKCRGCGEMLINPDVPATDDIAWICDKCEAMLNIQEGFSDDCGEWQCLDCGHVNRIDSSEVFLTDDEYKQYLKNPYKGLSNEAVIELMKYEEVRSINNRSDILLVKDINTGTYYVKKILCTYDLSIYEYLLNHPIKNMPRIIEIYESDKYLIIIEEYIEGKLLSDKIKENPLTISEATLIVKKLCMILNTLHSLEHPIIHRDVKPTNIIIKDNNEVYLLDVNVAKWYKENEIEDTRLLGTPRYAAPEQLGYGWQASSDKTDIYSVGVLLNILLTGKLPKTQKVTGPMWDIIAKCICLEPSERYSAMELLEELEK